MAIDTTTSVDVQTLTPFKKFIMTIGALPTSYLESMTYAELLMWFCNYLQETVIPTVNNNAEAVEELQNYVNHYFDNLDVQEEINKKLDEMAQNGSLTNLIKGYVDPLINEQNTEINTFKSSVNSQITTMNNKVNALESGSPLVASSTDDMTDTTRIYVNTTDGNWYYYDGDSWEIGGTYQATQLSNGTVSYSMLESSLQEDYVGLTTLNSTQPTTQKIILPNGTEQSGSSTNLGYYELSVNPFETYRIRASMSPSNWQNTSVRYMFKYNDTVISYKPFSTHPDYLPDTDVYEEYVTIPYNANKLIVNCDGLGKYSFTNIAKVSEYKHTNIRKEDLDSTLQTFFKDIYSEQTPTLFVDNAYMQTNGNITTYGSSKLYSLAVEPNAKYRITVKQIYANPVLLYGNPNQTYTYTVADNDYVVKTHPKTLVSETSGYSFENEIITIPYWCNTLYINKANNDSSFKIEKVTSYQVSIGDTDVATNPLDGKTLLFTGDSICAASTAGVKGWVGIMQENNPTTSFYNYAHDGYTIAKAEDEWSSRSIQNTLSTMLSEHPNADYIIFQGGTNDLYGSSHGITLGEILPSYDVTNVDRTSFTGGMEYIINYLYENFPSTKIVYIVTHQIYSNYFVPYMERAMEVCKKWSVPYINLLEDSNINYKISYMRTNFSLNNDGTHPNLEGYEIETPLIENALKYRI